MWGWITVVCGLLISFLSGFFIPQHVKKELLIFILVVVAYFTIKFAISISDIERMQKKAPGFIEEVCNVYAAKYSEYLITGCTEAWQTKEVFAPKKAFEEAEESVFENLFFMISGIKQIIISNLFGASLGHFVKPLFQMIMQQINGHDAVAIVNKI